MEAVLCEGAYISFDYPSANYPVRQRLERRRFHIKEIRDLEESPLEPETFIADPLLNRGPVLVTGTDLDKGAERTFYAHAMLNVEPIPEPTFAGDVESPQLFAVVELPTNRVVSRCLSRSEADAFAKQWAKFHGMTCTVTEPVILPSDDQVVGQLQ